MSDRKIILSSDYNFNVTEFTFRTDIVDKLIHFVIDCQEKIILTTACQDHDILVCMPSYIIRHLEELNRTCLAYDDSENVCLYFCGLKVQVSYENSITVFYNAYIPTKIIKYTQEL
ncbi:hypothetical protein D3C86_537190 [compost metagenome]